MKIVTLNIRHGGGTRAARILEYLFGQNADVIVLTEFRENATANVLRSAMSANGFIHFSSATNLPKQNSVCVFSRSPFLAETFSTLPINDRHRVIAAKFADIDIVGVYFSHGDIKRSLFEFFLGGSYRPGNPCAMVIGDFNTGLHYQDEAGATFRCPDLFAALPDVGLIDSWRSRNRDERAFSWYSNVGNGFRIDHVFCNQSADDRIQAVHYDHAPRESNITDHSALIVDIANL